MITSGVQRDATDENDQEAEDISAPTCDPDAYQSHLNEEIGRLPSSIQDTLKDQTVNVWLKTSEGGVYDVSAKFQGKKIVSISPDPAARPTLEIRTNLDTISDIASIKDEQTALEAVRIAIAQEDISISSSNRPFELALFNFANKLDLAFRAPQNVYAIKPNEQKSIVYNGKEGLLSMSSRSLRTVTYTGAKEHVVVNKYGGTEGYVPVEGHLIISDNKFYSFVTTKKGSVPLSRNAGIYTKPIDEITGWLKPSFTGYILPSGGVLYDTTEIVKKNPLGVDQSARRQANRNALYTGAAVGTISIR